jgi:hypothetical protein
MKKRGYIVLIVLVLGIFLVSGVFAEKIGIDVKNSYVPGDKVNFKITLYDNNNNKIDGQIDYSIRNSNYDTPVSGKISSGEEMTYNLPLDSFKGIWELDAKYKTIEANSLFTVGESRKIDIKLENDELVISNLGNVPYDNDIIISIGENVQTARVTLDIGQTKRIKLTAPSGEYEVKVNDGSFQNDVVFNQVSLTGNVIGLESVVGTNFWNRYPVIGLFLVSIVVVAFIVASLRFRNNLQNKAKVRKK